MNEKELHKGLGKLFGAPNTDDMRLFFKGKNKAMKNKLTSVSEAVSSLVMDGDYLAIGGFGGVRIPTAIIHEILRQKKKNLGFAGHVSTHDCQLLSAGKCFNRCDAAYIVGLEARGLSKNARRIFESGDIEITEWSNAALAWRFKAAAMGIPFLPARVMLGTDTFKYSAAIEMECPFTQQKLTALPALYPDVAIIHVHKADVFGNCQINGILVADDDISKASRKVIITTETIISNEEIRREPEKTVIPYWYVDAVIEVPYGSYPGNMPGEYFSDETHLKKWLLAEKDQETFEKFIEHQIYSSADFYEYLEKNGGMNNMKELVRLEHLY
ncbi:CoA transferase subunit A [Plebeiibacterium sediminum]|uniref:CoA transferase subunit A n=1 Tax=Plebeiibacterium sediminum TaxID=2992112 RepID=A0AAE3SGI0_9BACT|nr:CoA-transferase [Plebeiobacterium sediminum]MCW3788117.1 hypothetical protein [Plebeiobacterium sediminum]